jgi:hypothetical protein
MYEPKNAENLKDKMRMLLDEFKMKMTDKTAEAGTR